MVSLQAVRTHNTSLKDLGSGLVAVFVGGTSGIGLYTAREFVRRTSSPTVYLVGRNETRAGDIIAGLKLLNEGAQIYFIKADVSLLMEVDSACDMIQCQVNHVNVLFLSCGIFTLNRREETTEGLDRKFSLHYYARMRFIHNFIPQLTRAGCNKHGLSRVVSVLGAGHERKLHLDDLDLRERYGVEACDVHATTMTSLMVKEFALRYPSTTFIHTYPGIVKSGIAREAGPVVSRVIRAAMFLGGLWMVSEQESGARHLFAATSRQFSPGTKAAVRGITGGAYLLNWDGSEAGNRGLLDGYYTHGVSDQVWMHTQEMFRKALGHKGRLLQE